MIYLLSSSILFNRC